MRKIIKTENLDWEQEEFFKNILDVQRLPELIIIETVEEN
jgi:hypothetical protein